MTRKTCIVVGAGIVGSSCAWHLQKSGFDVSLIDDQPPGQVTSFGNAGCISPSSIVPFSYPGVIREVPAWLSRPDGALKIRWRDFPALAPWFWRFWRAGRMETVERLAAAMTPLMKQVHGAFDEILQATGDTDLLEKQGCLMVYDSADKLRASEWQFELMRRHGFSVREVEAAELEPDVYAPHNQARLLEDWHHVTDPGAVGKGIADSFISSGGALVEDRVKQISAGKNGVRADTVSGASFTADKLVCAAGVWSNNLARQLDHGVPLVPKRGYHSMLPNSGVGLKRPVYFAARSFIATPMRHGLRLAGTAEFARLDAPPNYKRARVLVDIAKKYLPGINAGGISEWMGQRPATPDSMAIISRSPNYPEQVFYAFGHGHYGLTQGPLTGRLIAQMASGREPDVDLTAFRFDRF